MRTFGDGTRFYRRDEQYRNIIGMIRAYKGSRLGRALPHRSSLVVYIVDGDVWLMNFRKKVIDHFGKTETAEHWRHIARDIQAVRRVEAAAIAKQNDFELRNDPPKPKHKRGDFHGQDRTLQKVLIDGLDCLPGQQDLF